MQFIKANKLYIGLVILAVLLWWLYMTFFSGGPQSSTLLTSTEASSPLSQEVLTTLSSLTVIRLDPSIFTDPVFTSLTDYGVQIPPGNVGRRNPFAPI